MMVRRRIAQQIIASTTRFITSITPYSGW